MSPKYTIVDDTDSRIEFSKLVETLDTMVDSYLVSHGIVRSFKSPSLRSKYTVLI
jgi:hypothetical protein